MARKFGIVAAMSKNGVIGIDGGIPWRIPHDRKLFKDLTDSRIVIIGRRTFREHPMLAHINHTRCCIVVSRSMKTIEPNSEHAPKTVFKLARSFPEALMLAAKIEELLISDENISTSSKNPQVDVMCWVAGGQQLYEEALLTTDDSCLASEIHLSVVDVEIDFESSRPGENGNVALFPPKSLWSDRFEELSNIFYPHDGDAPSFHYYVYRRK